jgi:hypothetical protein
MDITIGSLVQYNGREYLVERAGADYLALVAADGYRFSAVHRRYCTAVRA